MKRVYLITHGTKSTCEFVPENEVQAFLATLPQSERRCALITATDLTTDDVEVWERSRAIIKRLEQDIAECELTLETRFKLKRKGA